MQRRHTARGVARVIGIDPGLTRTGVAIGRTIDGKLTILKHLIIGAEGKTWWDKCEYIAENVAVWILNNTNAYDILYVMVEDVYGQTRANRAWASAIQNRLLSKLVHDIKNLADDDRTIIISTIGATTVKKMFTDNGHADKDDIMDRAMDMYRFKDNYSILNKETLGDTIAITWCGWKYYKTGIERKGINRL